MIILGAGITGLCAGYKTKGVIYEATKSPGGICMSYYLNGYRFERGGGHWIFGVDHDIWRFLREFGTFNHFQRDAGVYINKIFPYPIQNYFNQNDSPRKDTMKEWLYNSFGNDQCELFFYPFNEKYTDNLYNDIAPQDTYKNPIKSSGYNPEFIYPAEGLDSVITKLAYQLDIRYEKEVIKIDALNRMIYFSDGDSTRYDKLISTLPLNKMHRLLGYYLNEELPYNSTLVLNIGATPGRNMPKEHWLYIPYSRSGFHRVGFYTNVDSSFAPKNRISLYVEWAYNKVEPNIEEAVKELKDWGFINKVEVADVNTIDVAYTWGYPDCTDREDILSVLEGHGIKQIGRYGNWKFQGIAESIKEGLSC